MAYISAHQWQMALLAIMAYGLLCLAVWAFHKGRLPRLFRTGGAADITESIAVLYASQNGHALTLARDTARMLSMANLRVHLACLGDTNLAQLSQYQCALFIASTHYQGDPPDDARQFGQLMQQAGLLSLAPLRYAVLALGDSSYPYFCAFGRVLDQWLHTSGASRLFDRVELDGRCLTGKRHWHESVQRIFGQVGPPPEPQALEVQQWQLVSRQILNPGSQGEPIAHLTFRLPEQVSGWESGDLVEVYLDGHEAHPRQYSVASAPQGDTLELLVRLKIRATGKPGLASGHLVQGLPLGGVITGRLVENTNFRLGNNLHQAIVFIGNGSGMAGLRAHLQSRISRGIIDNWLIYGERQQATDFLFKQELLAWQSQGALARLDTVFSRDTGARLYVQDKVRQAAEQIRDWVHHKNAAIYVCGSLQGMGQAVDQVLHDILGSALVSEMIQTKRYRRDVYE